MTPPKRLRDPARARRRVPAREHRRAELQREHVLQLLRSRAGVWAASCASAIARTSASPRRPSVSIRRTARVVFNFKRPEIADNARFQAGGMRFEVEAPFERLRIEYLGSACRLADPLAMRDPRAAFQSNPFVPVEVRLEIRGVGPMFGGERERARAGRSRERVRARALRAAPPRQRPDRDRRRGERLRRARAARSLLGPAQLAGAALLPLADGKLRRRFRLHGELDREPGRQRGARGLPAPRQAAGAGAPRRDRDAVGGSREAPRPAARAPDLRGRGEARDRGPRALADPAAKPPGGPHHADRRGDDRVALPGPHRLRALGVPGSGRASLRVRRRHSRRLRLRSPSARCALRLRVARTAARRSDRSGSCLRCSAARARAFSRSRSISTLSSRRTRSACSRSARRR